MYVFFGILALCRYNGYEFETNKHNPREPHSLSGDRIAALIECEDGDLLIETRQMGLDLFDPTT